MFWEIRTNHNMRCDLLRALKSIIRTFFLPTLVKWRPNRVVVTVFPEPPLREVMVTIFARWVMKGSLGVVWK